MPPKPPILSGTGYWQRLARAPGERQDDVELRPVHGQWAASWRASVVPPRIRMRWSIMASELRLEPVRGPSMAVHRRHRRGRRRRTRASDARRHIAEAEFVFGGKRHLALAADLIKGRTAALAVAFRRGDARRAGAARPPRLRAGLRRSVPARRRRDASRGIVPADEMHVVPAPFRLQPGRRPAGLAAGRRSRPCRCTASRSI